MAARLRIKPVEVAMPASGVFAFASRHGRGFKADPMCHAFWKVLHVFAGRGRICTRGGGQPVAAGDTVCIPAGVRHQLVDDPGRPLSLLALCVSRRWVAQDVLPGPEGGLQRFPAGIRPSQQVRGVLRRILFEQRTAQAGHAAMLSGLAQVMMVRLLRHAAVKPARRALRTEGHSLRGDAAERVQQLMKRMESRFFEALSVDEAAAECRLSRRAFTGCFRRCAQRTFTAHQRHLRIGHARVLLRETQRSIVAVAFECGYDNLGSFYRDFKRECRTSPLRWRDARPESLTRSTGSRRLSLG